MTITITYFFKCYPKWFLLLFFIFINQLALKAQYHKTVSSVIVTDWKASWIWFPEKSKAVDFHFYARKQFNIQQIKGKALFHISAYSDYQLSINGHYIGRGPNPTFPKSQYYDTWDVAPYLSPGENTIAVMVHNYGVGLHWIPVGPGGLIAQLEIDDGNITHTIVTDSSWKVKQAESFGTNSPRMMWSCKFLETFDFNKYEEGWEKPGYDDSKWMQAQIIGRHPQYPWENLYSRTIPYFKEELHKSVTGFKGNYAINNFHVISFKDLLQSGKNQLGYAQTYFYADQEKEVTLVASCDDAFKIFLNDKLTISQNYDPNFVRGVTWNRREDYEQFHYSVGPRNESVKVILQKGWNKILVAVDQGAGGWGFVFGLSALAPQGNYNPDYSFNYLDLPFSSDKKTMDRKWLLAGPYESTGLKNSLENANANDIAGEPTVIKYHPFNYLQTTDYALLMNAEKRESIRKIDTSKSITLNEGDFYIVDLGKVYFGFPELEIESADGGIIDVGYSNTLAEDYKIRFIWQVRYVDRLILKKQVQHWQNSTKRECQYIHISCRKGQHIKIKWSGVKANFYPVKYESDFACSDSVLNNVWNVSRYSTHLLMQDGWQDGVKREEGVHNQRSFIHQFTSGYLAFGDTLLIKKNITDAIRSQDENGWFSSHGSTDNNADEPTQMLWWFVLLKKYYLYTGDTVFIKSLYEKMKGVLRYYSRQENNYMLLDGRNEFLNTTNRLIYIDDESSYAGISDKMHFGYNILYYGAMNTMSYFAKEFGYDEDASFYNSKANFVKEACNRLFYNDSLHAYVDWRTETTFGPKANQPVLIAALYYDIAPAERKNQLLSYLCDTLGGSKRNFNNYNLTVGFYYFLLDVLYRNGKEVIAQNLTDAYFGRWLELGATTFGEFFSLNDNAGKKRLDKEYNTHGYSTSPHEQFYTYILGVQPVAAGFKKLVIAPQPGNLQWAKGKVHTPKGVVSINWKTAGEAFDIDVQMPEDYKYKIVIPKGYKAGSITVNGKL